MKGLKKMVVLLAGLVMFLCANPVLAADAILAIPYAQSGAGWWSGLALSNGGWQPVTVTIYRTVAKGEFSHPQLRIVGEVIVEPMATKTDLLEEFFTKDSYPTANSGRVSLAIHATGAGDPLKTFRATLFMGNDQGGFAFQSFKHGD